MIRRLLVPLILGLASARAAAPDAVVAADGSGQYTTIQAAVSAAADRKPGEPRWTILVKAGTYKERVYVQRERGYITLVGEDVWTAVGAGFVINVCSNVGYEGTRDNDGAIKPKGSWPHSMVLVRGWYH